MPYYPAPAPPPKKSNTLLIVVIVVVIVVGVVVAGALAAYLGSQNAIHTVDITGVNLNFSGATNCWTSSTGSGGTVAGGHQFTSSWTMSYTGGVFQPASCTVQTVSVQTAGFSLVTANVPLVVNAGGSQTLTIVVQAPDANYAGALTLLATVSSP